MSASAVVSITDNRYQFIAGSKYMAIFNVAISASPAAYVTGGIAMNFDAASEVKATRTPFFVVVQGISGYIYSYVAGADATSGLLKIFQGGAAVSNPMAEIPASAIPAAVSGDTITGFAIFQGME